MSIIFPAPPDIGGQQHRSIVSFAGAAAAHGVAIALVLAIVPAERLADLARPIAVRLIELAPDNPPPPPKQPPKKASPAPLPVLVTNSPEPPAQPTTFTVPPQPPAPPAPVPIAVTVAAPPAVPVTAARFDADYLDNPKPVYPHASRRLGEQGKVLLRVHVSATGLAEKVEVKLGSGFTRLDQAAQDAVSRWRFVPARRGDEAVAAWVQVPITFQLDS